MTTCDRCGQESRNWNEIPTVEMYGGVRAALCTTCQIAFHEHMNDTGLGAQIRRNDAVWHWLRGRAMAGAAPTLQEWEALVCNKNTAKDRAISLSVEIIKPMTPEES